MKPFTIVDAPQRSPEWFQARIGRLTGSRASDITAALKGGGEPFQRRDLRAQLVVERLTGMPQEDGYINAVMQRGIDKEPDAFAAYEASSGNLVRRTGFLQHTELMAGCSVDGDVEDFTGIVELKCPKSAAHLSYWELGCVPANHLPQILHNLWITGATWCDFVSFDDRFPEGLQLFVCRVPRMDLDVYAYEQVARKFLAEVDAKLEIAKALLARAA
jgi:hypothetical protein